MKHKGKFLTFFVLWLVLLIPQTSAWDSSGTAICWHSAQIGQPNICSDGAGNAIIVWIDKRGGIYYDIYTQKVSSEGMVQWGPNGNAICTGNVEQKIPQVCHVGNGSTVIVWADDREDGLYYDYYAQKVDAAGHTQWTPNGVVVCNNSDTSFSYLLLDNVQICADGNGGTIIVWEDHSGGPTADLYAQKLNTNGNPEWGVNGVEICTASGNQDKPQIICDGDSGAIIIWQDRRGGTWDIYAQKIDSTGNPKWGSNGKVICNAANDQTYPKVCGDGMGGVIIVWADTRTGGSSNPDIYAQRVDSGGNLNWSTSGKAVCTAIYKQEYPEICSDGTGSAFIVWQDERGGNKNIYGQHLDSSGNSLWESNGKEISAASYDQQNPKICGDENGSIAVVWEDFRNGTYYDIYAQQLNSTGIPQWDTHGIPICNAWEDQKYHYICYDGQGGAFITWMDARNGVSNWDLYANHVQFSVGEVSDGDDSDGEIPGFAILYLLIGILGIIFIYRRIKPIKRTKIQFFENR